MVVSNPTAKLNIVSAFEVVKPAGMSVIAGIAAIRSLGRIHSLILLLAVNAVNQVVLKNTANAFKTTKNVDLNASALTVVMENE